jgi:GT2 family glycosyltransferase
MIVVLHQNNRTVRVLNEKLEDQNFEIDRNLRATLFSLAKSYPDDLILWCHEAYFKNLNFTNIDQIFYHPKMMVSYSVSNKKYLTERIGYVEDSPFINVKFDVSYPTWLMSCDVGGVHAKVLNAINPIGFQEENFNLFLNSLAKTTMSGGLLCYSNPNLLQGNPRSKIPVEQVSNFELFKFIRHHYKKRWIFFLFTALLLFEKKLFLFPLIASLFHQKKIVDSTAISEIGKSSKLETAVIRTVDVIIPTIGRKKYLYDVLMDLAAQTVLPKRVIIIEQNPDAEATSDLDYLDALDWPFVIVHQFIHQTGACNARNLAIKEIKSEWVFMADDDIRIPKNALEDVFRFFQSYTANAITLSCLRDGDSVSQKHVNQWNSFGSGCSFVASELVKSTFFNTSFEHGFGEDAAYGMQLRNKGYDVLYQPNIELRHLKAPIGGFRNPIEKPWESEDIRLKPSPTIMLYRLKHTTKQQLWAYKLVLFIKFYKNQQVKNLFIYIKKMNKGWNSSVNWANKLDKE